jgi:hypothetical protein
MSRTISALMLTPLVWMKKICGMIAVGAIISGANPIPRGGRWRAWTKATPRAGTFARAG